MLWYKSWLETRWRFLIGFGLLVILAIGIVIEYPAVAKLMPLAGAVDTSGPLGQLIKQAADVQRDFRGFVWWQWFRQNLTQTWTLVAVLLGSGGLLSQTSGGAALFTLSLPASRNRLIGVRAATGLAELFVLAVVPSLLIPLFSPAIGETYGVGNAIVHGLCLFVAGSAFFSLALLLSTVFSDLWRPMLLGCGVAIVLALAEQIVRELSPYGLFRVMSGELYFRTGSLPWGGLLAGAVASGALLYGATVNFARHDF